MPNAEFLIVGAWELKLFENYQLIYVVEPWGGMEQKLMLSLLLQFTD